MVLAVASCVGAISSYCTRIPDLEDKPRIIFKSMRYVDRPTLDSILITFDFEDGNGDLGLADSDTAPPYNFANGRNPNYYNLVADYFEFNPATGTFDSLGGALRYNYRFRPLFETGQIGKPLTGTFTIGLQDFNFPDDRDIMFKIQLKDRALNVSNRVSTSPFRKPTQ